MIAVAEAPAADVPLSRHEFEEAVVASRQPLQAFALHLARNAADADDLIQETLLRAWRGIRGFRRGSHFTRWTMRILRNVFLTRVQKDKRRPVAIDPATLWAEAPPAPQPQATGSGDFGQVVEHFDDRVKAAVEELPPKFREPLLLLALGGLSYQEIADTLGIPIGTVMSRLHRARHRMRRQLADHVPAA